MTGWAISFGILGLIVALFAIYRAFSSPVFLAKLTALLSSEAWKLIRTRLVPKIVKRLPADLEAEMRLCVRRGGTWDLQKKKCVYGREH